MEYLGKYIAIEGIDGVGKTTQIKLLKNWFESLDIPLSTTRELSDGLIGKFSRDLLNKGLYLPSKTLALLWASDTQHNQEKPEGVVSHLKQGSYVLSDRCYLSAYAYLLPECEISWISELHKFCLIPDITIVLDLDPNVAFNRIEKRNEKLQEFETLTSLIKIRENYLNLTESLKDVWKIIEIVKFNESTSIDELQQAIRQKIGRYLA